MRAQAAQWQVLPALWVESQSVRCSEAWRARRRRSVFAGEPDWGRSASAAAAIRGEMAGLASTSAFCASHLYRFCIARDLVAHFPHRIFSQQAG